MAAIYIRKKSRFYWINYRDPATGDVVQKSTGIDRAFPTAKQDAKRLAAEWTMKEMTAPRTSEAERWESWALEFFEQRYLESPGSLKNSKTALLDLLVYFKERSVRTPRQVTYPIAADFVPWRVSNRSMEKIGQNTGRLRFVYFRLLMSEAVKRGFAQHNPCREVRNKSVRPKEKNEITPKDEATIEKELEAKPQWMRDQWSILMCQGCRIAETIVPLSRIDTDRMTITFRLKGGRLHTTALHENLLPLVAKARSEGREALIECPPAGSLPAIWSDFFTRRNLPYSIHCTRVTVITRLVRANVPEPQVVSFIGHSKEISRIYQKLKPADSRSLLKLLGAAATPAEDNTGK